MWMIREKCKSSLWDELSKSNLQHLVGRTVAAAGCRGCVLKMFNPKLLTAAFVPHSAERGHVINLMEDGQLQN